MFDILTHCPLFRGLDAAQIKEILGPDENYSVTGYAKGDVIAHRDTAYSGLMIILRGKATGVMTYASGQQVTVDSLEAGQLIAPAFLFGGYNRLPIDVIADTDVQILTLHRGFIFELMQEHTLILSNFIDIISNRANVWSRKIYFLSFRSLREKLSQYLLENSTEENPVVPVPDIAEIADIFAATRSSLVAVLDDLEKKHIIATDHDQIKILRPAALKDILK